MIHKILDKFYWVVSLGAILAILERFLEFLG